MFLKFVPFTGRVLDISLGGITYFIYKKILIFLFTIYKKCQA